MNTATLSIFCLILFFFFCGCGIEFGEWRITALYMQKIEGTSKVLYQYDAWGGLDDNAHGFIILDSSETFKIDLKKQFPFYHLSDIPNKLNIEGVAHECFSSCDENYAKSQPVYTPMKSEEYKYNEINILTRTYQYRGFSEKQEAAERYVFESCVETKDSIYFYNLNDTLSMNGIHLDEIKIKKGEVYLQQNEKNEVKRISINEVILNPKTKAIECFKNVDLTPINRMNKSNFSERGIFNEVEIPK